MLGTFVLSAGYYDAYYSKAQKVRRLIQDETQKILNDHDFILTPTTPSVAFKIGEKLSDPIVMYLEDIFTVQASLTGFPAISLPLFRNSQGLAFGVQILAGPFQEEAIFSFSHYLEDLIPGARKKSMETY
jgi:aspartyl-tRNA(Asn)/glutamyl-tRNA(Gln) amidotransferase subunit A